jgi:hypothetical protein
MRKRSRPEGRPLIDVLTEAPAEALAGPSSSKTPEVITRGEVRPTAGSCLEPGCGKPVPKGRKWTCSPECGRSRQNRLLKDHAARLREERGRGRPRCPVCHSLSLRHIPAPLREALNELLASRDWDAEGEDEKGEEVD